MPQRARGVISVCGGLAVAGVMAAFVVWRIIESSQQVDEALLREHGTEAAVAIVASMLAVLALGFGWASLLRNISPHVRAERVRLLSIFSFTWPGRYVPGTVPFLAARIYVASRAGYGTRAPAVATGFQSALEVLSASAFGVTALVFARNGAASPLTWALAAGVIVVTVMALHPRALAAVSTAARRVLRRGPSLVDARLPSRGAIATSIAGGLACQVLTTMAVVAVTLAFTDIGGGDIVTVAAAVSLSGVAGVLVVLAPAGLGVRDGALAAMLAWIMPLETAASVAVAYRALTVVSDVLLASIALGVDRLFAWKPGGLAARTETPAAEQHA